MCECVCVCANYRKLQDILVVHCFTCWRLSLSLLQQFELKPGDIETLGKIGNGISGEVFRMKFKPTGAIMAAKVSYAV